MNSRPRWRGLAMKRIREALESPWIGAVAIGGVATVVLLAYDPWEHPLMRDRAYFVYCGQLVLRGASIYSHTWLGYPPLGLLLSGASMWVGSTTPSGPTALWATTHRHPRRSSGPGRRIDQNPKSGSSAGASFLI